MEQNEIIERKSKMPEYLVWQRMKSRCYHINGAQYNDYGGRGISVSDTWVHSFENFYNDMGPRPSKNHSLDRHPNINGNYEPGNCKWSTRKEQARNRRSNVLITHNGITQCRGAWAEMIGIDKETFRLLMKRGVTMDIIMDKNSDLYTKSVGGNLGRSIDIPRKVGLFDLSGNLIEQFPSMLSAAATLKISYSGLKAFLEGRRKPFYTDKTLKPL